MAKKPDLLIGERYSNKNIPRKFTFISLPEDVMFSIYNEFLSTIEKIKLWGAGYCTLQDCDILKKASYNFVSAINYFKNKKNNIIDINSIRIDDLAFGSVLRNILRVEKIKLKKCTMLTQLSISRIGQFRELLSLNIAQCTQIEDHWLMEIAKSCKHVNYLDASFCDLISTDCILNIIQNYWKLNTLNLEYTRIQEQPVFEMSKRMGIANLSMGIFPLIKNGINLESHKSTRCRSIGFVPVV